MNTTIRNTALASILFAAASGAAFAADTADLTVKGVIKPASCKPSFSGGSTVDYGTIPASSLSATEGTAFESKLITLTINCDAPTKLGLTVKDGREGTENASSWAAVSTKLGGGVIADNAYGVGSIDGKNIGSFTIRRGTAANAAGTADGAQVESIFSWNGTTWGSFSTSDWAGNASGRMHSWAPAGTSAPGSYKTIVQPYQITLGVGKISELPPLTNDITIDGLATFSLVYL